MNSKSQKILKNSLLAAGILLTCGMVQAQSTDNKSDSTQHSMHHRSPRNGGDGPAMRHPGYESSRPQSGGWADRGGWGRHGGERGRFGRGERIHYSPEQRTQLAAINKDYHDKSAALFQKDNITLNEYKAGLRSLQ